MVKKYKLVFTKQAQKDAKKIKQAWLKDKTINLLSIIENDPFKNPPPYEKLLWDLRWAYSRRINIKHRIIYEVLENELTVKIIRMWTHYE